MIFSYESLIFYERSPAIRMGFGSFFFTMIIYRAYRWKKRTNEIIDSDDLLHWGVSKITFNVFADILWEVK